VLQCVAVCCSGLQCVAVCNIFSSEVMSFYVHLELMININIYVGRRGDT